MVSNIPAYTLMKNPAVLVLPILALLWKMNLCGEWTSPLPERLQFDLHDFMKQVVCRLETHKKTSVRW